MSIECWVSIPKDAQFSVDNLPYGIFSTPENPEARIGVAIGAHILDIRTLCNYGLFESFDFDTTTLRSTVLNPFAALGLDAHNRFRGRIRALLQKDGLWKDELQQRPDRHQEALVEMAIAKMHKPMVISGYTDVLAGFHHTRNCAQILRPDATPDDFAPRFYDAPVAYNGRTSSIVVSETSFARPRGPVLRDGKVACQAAKQLDFEVEFAVLIGRPSTRDHVVHVDAAAQHIFGFVLMNDWSARDIQFTESRPLGPFNGKQTCTTISPWVVTPAALEPFLTALDPPVSEAFRSDFFFHRSLQLTSAQGRSLMPYLTPTTRQAVYDIPIRATLESADKHRYHIATCNTQNLIWTFEQMLAHHTVSGCPLETGDLIATGTLSGPSQAELGCLYELTAGGKVPVELRGTLGQTASRTYLKDGDTVEFSAVLPSTSGRGGVGFGLCRGTVAPAMNDTTT